MLIIPRKVCRRCGVEKPLSEFGPYPRSKDGHFHNCKLCIKYRRVPIAEYLRQTALGLVHCFKCRAWKQPEQMVKSTAREGGLAARCLDCHRVVSNSYVKRNRKRMTQTARAWRKNNESKAKEISRRWRANPANAEKARQSYKRWAEANPANVIANVHKRRARIQANGGSFTAGEWKALCQKYGNRCLCCGKRKKLTADHVVPLAAGGPNVIENIQPLCRECNSAKRTKIIDYRPKPAEFGG